MLDLQIPKSLSDVITQNTDELALDLIDIDSLKKLAHDHLDGQLRGKINPAYLVEMTWHRDTAKERKDIHVLGMHAYLNVPYSTSRVVAISPDSSKVQTYSGSIYDISDIRTSEPSTDLLLHMCATLHFWRLGRYFGVLEVFY